MTFNPFAIGHAAEIANRMAALMPPASPMTADEQAAFDAERKAGELHYKEARYGPLPADTYRILEQGGFAGWHLELEIDGEEIILKGDPPDEGCYAVFANRALAAKLARADKFVTVWGGCL